MSIYLDHAAATPVRAEARAAFLEAIDRVGNPASVHRAGQATRALLETARAQVADVAGVAPIEVVFTSGGTESINLALRGLYRARRREDPRRRRIIFPAGEHHATIDSLEHLASTEDAVLEEVPLDEWGRIQTEAWREALARDPETLALATSIHVNNEVGTRHDVDVLHESCVEAKVPLHIDAVASFGHEHLCVSDIRSGAPSGIGLVAVSLSGHKVGAVSGSGVLVLDRSIDIEPLVFGGGQERGLRSGTPSVAAAVSLGVAAQLADVARVDEQKRLDNLRTRLISRLASEVSGVRLTVPPEVATPHILSVLIEGAHAESLIFLLDREGISVSAGSACQSGVSEASHVIAALGVVGTDARSAIRVSFGHTTTPSEVERFADVLPSVVEQARNVRYPGVTASTV